MRNQVEEAKGSIEENEQKQVAVKGIFDTAINILKKSGEELSPFSGASEKVKILEHPMDNSPAVKVIIRSDMPGTKLDDSEQVIVEIQNFDMLIVGKVEGDSTFTYYSTTADVKTADLKTLDRYLATVRDVKWEIEAPEREAARLATQPAPKPQ